MKRGKLIFTGYTDWPSRGSKKKRVTFRWRPLWIYRFLGMEEKEIHFVGCGLNWSNEDFPDMVINKSTCSFIYKELVKHIPASDGCKCECDCNK